jgi:hypothetical protein
MTSERDFDRIARAWLDMGPNEAPDRAVAAVLQAVESTPQVRRPLRWPVWRATTMTRVTLLAVLAGTIAIAIGALALSGGSRTTTPAPSAVPSSAPAVVASPSPRPLPDALLGGWVTTSRGTTIENLTKGTESALGGNAAVTTVVFMDSADFTPGPAFWLDRRGTPLLSSSVTEESPGVLRLTMTTMADPDCVGKDSGTYDWSQSPDGQWLTLELIEDACEARAEILPGTWQRSLAHDSPGGPGIATVLAPFVAFTLPAEAWRGIGLGEFDTVAIDNGDGTADMKIWKDPDGFVAPCDREAGRLDLEPGIDAFLAYLRDSPQFTVIDETELTVDGRRAVEVEIRLGDDIQQPCDPLDGNEADRRGILLWASHAADGTFWNGTFGDQWSLVVTEVDGTTLLMEIARQDGTTWPVDRDVLDSIRFLDALPTPPAS